MLTGSQRGRRRRRRIPAQRVTRAAAHVDKLLRALRFHRRAIKCLATRDLYADAAHALARIAEPDRSKIYVLPVIFVELTTPDIFLRRLAMRFGLLPEDRKSQPVSGVTCEEIRARAAESEGARLVLAALGEINWSAALTHERAVYCLAELVAAFKRRVS